MILALSESIFPSITNNLCSEVDIWICFAEYSTYNYLTSESDEKVTDSVIFAILTPPIKSDKYNQSVAYFSE